MKSLFKAGLAIVAVAATSFSAVSASHAGGLYGSGMRGSVKDAPMVQHTGGAGRCYLRGDVGYSHSSDPIVNIESIHYDHVGTDNEEIDGAWMGEIGIGCGSGSRGLRADFTLGYRGDRDITGHKPDRPGLHFPADFSSKVNSLTAMANLYYDFGVMHGFVPYVGVGIGIARHDMSDVTFDFAGYPATNRYETIGGSTQTNFAWSLMAGAAYQISHRAVLDFGYRFIDMGEVTTRGNICDTCAPGGSQERFSVDDMYAHEFKVGLRYHFGASHPVAYK